MKTFDEEINDVNEKTQDFEEILANLKENKDLNLLYTLYIVNESPEIKSLFF